MMDKEAIIDNGLIERYVLGDLEDNEKEAVEKLLADDQEVKTYFEEVENGLRQVAMDNAIAPPAEIKERMMMQVSDPVFMALSEENDVDESQENTKEIQVGGFNWPLAIAASFALLFLTSSVWFYNQWQDSVIASAQLKADLNQLQVRMASTEQTLYDAKKWNEVMKMPRTDKLVLKGNAQSPNLSAVAFVNHTEKEVYFNTEKLPRLSDNETYQAWADVEGVMVNMGTISTEESMVSLQYIAQAESVNLTIEPAGGSDHPTVERLVANVYL